MGDTPAFVIVGTDNLVTSLLSAFNYATAIEIVNANAELAGFEGDLCAIGLTASGSSNVNVTGADFFSHFTSVISDGNATVTVAGSHLVSNGNAVAIVRSAGATLVLSGNTILRDALNFAAPAIRVEAAQRAVISGNTIVANGVGLVFAGAPARGSVFGNIISIVDAASPAWFPATVDSTAFSANATNRVP